MKNSSYRVFRSKKREFFEHRTYGIAYFQTDFRAYFDRVSTNRGDLIILVERMNQNALPFDCVFSYIEDYLSVPNTTK